MSHEENIESGETHIIFDDNGELDMEVSIAISPGLTITDALKSGVFAKTPKLAKTLQQIELLARMGAHSAGDHEITLTIKNIRRGSITIELIGQIISSNLDFNSMLWGSVGNTKVSAMDFIQYLWEIHHDLSTPKNNNGNKFAIVEKYFEDHPGVAREMEEAIIKLSEINGSGSISFKGESNTQKFSTRISYDESTEIKISKKEKITITKSFSKHKKR